MNELEQLCDDLRRLGDELEQVAKALRDVLHAVNLREARVIVADALGAMRTSDVLERVERQARALAGRL